MTDTGDGPFVAPALTESARNRYPNTSPQPRKDPKVTALPHHCPRCDGRWNGLNTAHCGADGCHQTFTGLTAFDAHRAGKFTDDTRHCVHPARVGLVKADREYPCWALPGSNPRFSGKRAEVHQ